MSIADIINGAGTVGLLGAVYQLGRIVRRLEVIEKAIEKLPGIDTRVTRLETWRDYLRQSRAMASNDNGGE